MEAERFRRMRPGDERGAPLGGNGEGRLRLRLREVLGSRRKGRKMEAERFRRMGPCDDKGAPLGGNGEETTITIKRRRGLADLCGGGAGEPVEIIFCPGVSWRCAGWQV